MTQHRKHHDDDRPHGKPQPKAEPTKHRPTKEGDPPPDDDVGPPPSTFGKGAPGDGGAEARPAGEWEHPKAADEPAREIGTPAEAVKGTLYCVEGGDVYLMSDKGQRGSKYAAGEGAEVEINGKVTPLGLDDLKRGDEVSLEGDPVSRVVAVRRSTRP